MASLLTGPEEIGAFNELLCQREPSPDGHEPEGRVVYSGVSWERYLALDKLRGDDCSYPRFCYLDGDLEIMTTSGDHERIKTWLGDFLIMFFEEATNFDIWTRGEATMHLPLKEAGAEPDDSWCIGEEKEFPDLVLEIALTSGGIRKLELYQRFAVPEVWFWRRGRLEMFALRPDGSAYDQTEGSSRLLPGLDIALLERCVAIRNWREARRTFRAGLAAGK